jgi:hypothetical protein
MAVEDLGESWTCSLVICTTAGRTCCATSRMAVLKSIADMLIVDVALIGATAVGAAVGAALIGAALAVGDSAALLVPPIWHAATDMRTTSNSATRANARNPQ